MEAIKIEASDTTPKIILDPTTDKFELGGESRPENARKFYGPIIDWFDKYNQFLYWLKDEKGDAYRKDITVNFSLEYLRSTSIKYVYDLLKKIEELKTNATSVKINWNYKPGEENMKEIGEEYSRMIAVDFKVVSK